MFQPQMFRETRPEILQSFMHEHAFATLTTSVDGVLYADHIPFVFEAAPNKLGVLRGHIARANPLFRNAPNGCGAMVIFQGPHAYISPSWYASKAEHGRVVPTWNYIAVHAQGRLKFVSDSVWIQEHLETLTHKYESRFPAPWGVADAPEDYTSKLMRQLIGIEIDIVSLVGQWKCSQNKSQADRAGVTKGLLAQGELTEAMVADLVRK